MKEVFYIAAVIAFGSTLMVITRKNVVHALLYLIVSLLSISVIFFIVGAPFVAALEVIIYAGAVMVLFVFVIMMLNADKVSMDAKKEWFSLRSWMGPGILTLVLLVEFIYVIIAVDPPATASVTIAPREVGLALFGPYVLAVELVAMLLMAGVVGAHHISSQKKKEYHRYLQQEDTI